MIGLKPSGAISRNPAAVATISSCSRRPETWAEPLASAKLAGVRVAAKASRSPRAIDSMNRSATCLLASDMALSFSEGIARRLDNGKRAAHRPPFRGGTKARRGDMNERDDAIEATGRRTLLQRMAALIGF